MHIPYFKVVDSAQGAEDITAIRIVSLLQYS
jgi:hypothetical protein